MAALLLDPQHDLLKEIIESDFVDFADKIGDGNKEHCIQLLKQSKIYYLYQQVITEPLIIEYPAYFDKFTDVLIYNINLWYFALQLGIANKEIDFTIKGGFSIQLMVDGKYNTEDIDVKVNSKTDAQRLYELLLKLFPENIPFGYTYSSRFFKDKEQYKVSISRPNGMKTALIDIEFSSPPNNTRDYLNEKETHYRKVIIDRNEIIMTFSIYPLDKQIGEKTFLLNKYGSLLKYYMNRIIQILQRYSTKPIHIDNQDDFFLYLKELFVSYKKYPYDVFDDEAKKNRMKEVIIKNSENLFSLIHMNLNDFITSFDDIATELANIILDEYPFNGEIINLSYLLFLLPKFTKSYNKLTRKNTSNRWSNQTRKNDLIKSEKNERNRLIEQLKNLQNEHSRLSKQQSTIPEKNERNERNERNRLMEQLKRLQNEQEQLKIEAERQRREAAEERQRKEKEAANEKKRLKLEEEETKRKQKEKEAAAKKLAKHAEEQRRKEQSAMNQAKAAEQKATRKNNSQSLPSPPKSTRRLKNTRNTRSTRSIQSIKNNKNNKNLFPPPPQSGIRSRFSHLYNAVNKYLRKEGYHNQ
jgi:hypothetical protein